MAAAWPQNYLTDSGTQFESFDSTAGFILSMSGNSSGSSYSIDTNNYKSGTGCLKVVTPTGNGTTYAQFKTPSASITCKGRLGFWFQVDDVAAVDKISIFFSMDTGFTSYWLPEIQFNTALTNDQQKFNGWRWIELAPSAANGEFAWSGGAGTPSFPNTYTNLQVRVYAVSGRVATVRFDDARCDVRQRPILLITADDGVLSWYENGIPELDSRGLKHTWSIIHSTIDTGGNPTSAQLATAYANGHDLCPHGGAVLTSLSLTEAAADVRENIQFLSANGWTRATRFYVWPGGQYQYSQGDSSLIDILSSAGISAARGVATPKIAKMPYGMADRAFLIPVLGWMATDTTSAVLARIDNAIRNGAVCCLMFHACVSSGATSTDINVADLRTILDGVSARKNAGLLDVMTASEFLTGLTQPALVP